MKKLLAFNTILTEKYKKDFDKDVIEKITKGFPYKILHLENEIEKNFNYLSRFSHLLITGSSLSAAAGSEFDEIIFRVIRSFLEKEKPILGICYGHQMIARAILGDLACRKTKKPEFGWYQVKISKNQLFANIEKPIFLESHYDEVCNLTDDFQIIATNENCEIQAFQYRELPVWGTQFHPEMNWQNGTEMVREHLAKNPKDKQFFSKTETSEERIAENFLIFENFLHE